jgi:hypothetical protein
MTGTLTHLMRLPIVLFTILTALGTSGCSTKPDDETIETQLVGIWSFNPREQLPPEKIDQSASAYMTPDQQIFQFEPIAPGEDARGEFVEYRHIPEHTNSSNGSTMKARWVIMQRGRWYAANGKVKLQAKNEAEFEVLTASAGALRVGGLLFPCKDACVLRPLSELPEAVRSAEPW